METLVGACIIVLKDQTALLNIYHLNKCATETSDIFVYISPSITNTLIGRVYFVRHMDIVNNILNYGNENNLMLQLGASCVVWEILLVVATKTP